MKDRLALGALAVFLLSGVPLFAQDTPVGPEGTQLATQETPAAATNSDALRNAAQNPVASLISVPIQENFNFNIGPADRTQNVLNIQPVITLSVSKNWTLIVRWTPKQQCVSRIRHESVFFLGAEEKQDNLGHRANSGVAYSYKYDLSRAGKIQLGSVGGSAGAAPTLDDRISYKQHLVCSRSFQSR